MERSPRTWATSHALRLPRLFTHVCVVVWFLLSWGIQQALVAENEPRPVGNSAQFLDRVFHDDAGDHKYVVFVPRDYRENSDDREWPVILFLHGAGERGTDGRRQLTAGLGPLVKARADSFPFLVVFPQCEDTRGRLLHGWLADSPDGKRALAILDQVEKDFRVDREREILTGWSMGGFGAWSLAAADPERWSAVLPVSGGGEDAWAKSLVGLPIWAIHGALDTAVRPEASRRMVDAVRAAKGTVRYTEVPEVGHDVWKLVYNSDAVYDWMQNPTLDEEAASEITFEMPPSRILAVDDEEPFAPAIEIENAAYARLGNEMLDALAYSVPQHVPDDLLRGHVEDLSDTTTAEGRTFSVWFTEITYRGELEQTRIEGTGPNRINIQLGLRHVALNIGTTYVTGRDHSAVAGPIQIAIGTERPAWLSFDVEPYVQNRRLHLKLLSSGFTIEDDNWYVTSPAGVSTRGLGMTRDKVSRGLVSGLYGSKARLEREIAAIVPSLLEQLEDKLTLTGTDDVMHSFWPLPLYAPKTRLWPRDVSADAQGVSIVLGLSAAALDPARTPKTPKHVRSSSVTARDVPQVKVLRVGILPDLLRELSSLMIDADLARIHVLDLPEPKFGAFTDQAVLRKLIPDWKRIEEPFEVWSEFVLEKPLAIRNASNDESGLRLSLELPRLALNIAVRPVASKGSQQAWKPIAKVTYRITQPAQGTIVSQTVEKRAFRLNWIGDPELHVIGSLSPDWSPNPSSLDLDGFRNVFRDAWITWTREGPLSQSAVPDIDFGLAKLRISRTGWASPYLFVDFSIPGVRIKNRSTIPLKYEIKAPYSGWGGPYELAPGKTHEYEVPYPLLYRRRTDSDVKLYTLPAGSVSEFRVPQDGGPPSLFRVTTRGE